MVGINSIMKTVHAVAPKYDIERVVLFGSYAKGDHSASSDVDMLLDTGSKFSLFDAARLRNELSDLLGTDVDVVSRMSLYEPIAQDILSSQVLLYER